MQVFSRLAQELDQLDQQGMLREHRAVQSASGAMIQLEGQELINFASNDYLGLAHDADVCQAARQAIQTEGWGAGASPLVCGYSLEQQLLELELATFRGTEAALVFGSGFAANSGVLASLVGKEDLLLADHANHASLMDGCRVSGAKFRSYPHGNLARLEQILRREAGYRERWIVTDTVFSMDGDLADLKTLADLAQRYHAGLILDEAHATGVFGSQGRGVAELCGIDLPAIVHLGTLSKALGSIGGFVAGPQVLIDWVINRARPYIFSTALPPACAAASRAALRKVGSEPQRRTNLLATAAKVRKALQSQGWNIGNSASQIIPLIVGDPGATVELSHKFATLGLFLPAIRPPAVPADTSRLRLRVTSQHTNKQIEQL